MKRILLLALVCSVIVLPTACIMIPGMTDESAKAFERRQDNYAISMMTEIRDMKAALATAKDSEASLAEKIEAATKAAEGALTIAGKSVEYGQTLSDDFDDMKKNGASKGQIILWMIMQTLGIVTGGRALHGKFGHGIGAMLDI